MAIERIVDTLVNDDDDNEQVIEVTLRPQNFTEYIGQDRLKKNLNLAISAAKKARRTDRSRTTIRPTWAW